MYVVKKYYEVINDAKDTSFITETRELDTTYIKYPCKLFADQASKTGMAVFDSDARLVATYYVVREKDDEVMDYKHFLMRNIEEAIDEFKIDTLYHEEVYAGKSFDVLTVLMTIKDAFHDVGYVRDIPVRQLNNKAWKSALAHPNNWVMSIDEKLQVQMYVRQYYPLLTEPQDVYDAIGEGLATLLEKGAKSPVSMKLNKRLVLYHELWVMNDEDEDLYERLESSNFAKKFKKKGFRMYDYYDPEDYDTNARRILSSEDKVAIAIVPEHRTLGQILLKFKVKKSMMGENSYLMLVSQRSTGEK